MPVTFKEALGLPQAARWKTASDKEIASLEKHALIKLVTITSCSTIGGGGGHKFVPVLGGNGTKIAPPEDLFDQPPDGMS